MNGFIFEYPMPDLSIGTEFKKASPKLTRLFHRFVGR